jgi:hypothetical protein
MFNSRWWVPGTEAVNCLTQNSFNDNNWLVPPPRMVIQCIDNYVTKVFRMHQ